MDNWGFWDCPSLKSQNYRVTVSAELAARDESSREKGLTTFVYVFL
jgi:hypothetical protein